MENILLSKFSVLSVESQQELLDFLEFLTIKQQKNQTKISSLTIKPLIFGELAGNFKMSADFNDALEDFNEYM